MKNEVTVYYLDRPGAWGGVGLGAILLSVPLSLMVAVSIPGVFAAAFPNAPKVRDPLGEAFLAAVALGFMAAGVWFLKNGIRTLRDHAPKLTFNWGHVIDHRGGTVTAWHDVVSVGYAMTSGTGSRPRAVLTLTLRDSIQDREVEIDVLGLSRPPVDIYRAGSAHLADHLRAESEH